MNEAKAAYAAGNHLTKSYGDVIIMINSHYVPQLILRHFANAERIQYCDLGNRKVETRNIRSTFSEKGYYPDEIEKEMCYKIESQFANLLNKKLLNERWRITLTRDELFILKKYLIVTTIRYNCTEAIKKYGNPLQAVQGYSDHFYDNINKVLATQNSEELARLMSISPSEKIEKLNSGRIGEFNSLFADIKNIMHSYIVFVSTHRCGECFIVPDTGFAYQATHLAVFQQSEFDKCMYTLSQAIRTHNPYLLQIAQMLTPYDMFVCPVSKEFAVLSLSIFYKFFNRQSDIYGLLSTEGLTVNRLLGFGDSNMVEPPKVKLQFGKATAYEYSIQQLSFQDVLELNARMINNSERYIGFQDFEKIKNSIEYYSSLPDDIRRFNMDFLMSTTK